MLEHLFSHGHSDRLDRGDKRLMWCLTVAYTVFTLMNLGTLSFPENAWRGKSGTTAVLDLGDECDISSIWFNGNIAVGEMLITADDGQTFTYSQVYGEMFSWRAKPVGFRTRFLYLQPTSGEIVLNEIALLDHSGQRLAVTSTDGGEGLVDEQDTVPKHPSYYNGMYFDEIYHARTAYEFLHTMSVYEWTHPPLGKELISLGIAVFGMSPFGWRVVPALFGAAMLPIMFIFGKRLFRRRDYAFLACALLSLDTMHFTQTRIATVDVFVVFFILLMYLFMTDYLQKDNAGQPLGKALVPLGACGVSFGLGTAAKWTGLYAGAGLAVLFFTHLIRSVSSKDSAEERHKACNRALKTIVFCFVFFLLIPAAIYFASYIPFYRYESSLTPGIPMDLRRMTGILFSQQKSMYGYHSTLTATHSSQSSWYEWPFSAMSVWFYFSSGDRFVSNISTFGNPAVWWISAVGTLCAVTETVFGLVKNDPPFRKKAIAVLMTAVAANYLPWTLVTRCTFQYHYFPTLPFVILCGVLMLQHLEERGEVSSKAKWGWLILSALFFMMLFPACSGIPMPRMYARFLEYVVPAGNLFHGAI